MYIVTGGAGFIGSAIVWALNKRGISNITIVDHNLDKRDKKHNLKPLEYESFIDKDQFIQSIREDSCSLEPSCILHLGACSSTTVTDMEYLKRNNYQYTVDLAQWALENETRFIYASSAATYGDGSKGYSDNHELIPELEPLNPYGRSKQMVDETFLERGWLDQVVGLKYFNVFGPNEYHKGEMRSVIHKSVPQAQEDGVIKLFKSHRDDYEHGQQERDFLYVKDAVDMTMFFVDNPDHCGIYNIGSGTARTFDDLAKSVFDALDKPLAVEYFDMPEDIRPNYQYHTEAQIAKLREAGWSGSPTTLEDSVKDYLQQYVLTDAPHLTPA